MDDDAKRDAVKSAIAEFQEFCCRRHNLENTMPWQQQDSEASDGVLAESAPGEPVHTSPPTDPWAAYRAYEAAQ